MDPKEINAQLEAAQKPEPAKSSLTQAVLDGLRQGVQQWKEDLQAIRSSTVAKAIDNGIDFLGDLAGASGKAWVANGMVELQSVFQPGAEYVQLGSNPGGWGLITGIEAAHDRGV